ncbi:hypothetical protein V3C99_011309, partial [Haemonchus contortus]
QVLIALLFTFHYCQSSNYSIFYHRNPSLQYYAAINVTSRQFDQFERLDRLSFDIHYLSGQSAVVLLNNKKCQTTCDIFLKDGESALLTFDGDNENIISFYQFYQTITYLYYRSCFEPMEIINCRFRQTSTFEICICKNHVSECTYDEPLYFDEPWCNESTKTPTEGTATNTSSMTTSTISFNNLTTTTKLNHSNETIMKEFYLRYQNLYDHTISNNSLLVDVSLLWQESDSKVIAVFNVQNGSKLSGLHFVVNGNECQWMCMLVMGPNRNITAGVYGYPCDDIVFSVTRNNEIQVFYDFCEQPMDNVGCRMNNCLLDVHLCNKNGNSTEPFLLEKDNCTSTYNESSTTLSSRTTTTTSLTSSTIMPTTTPDEDVLRRLSEGGIGLNNVSRILNETLVYAESRSNLTSIQIQEITTILNKSAALNGLQPDDSKKVLLNMDCILSADPQQIRGSGNSSQTLNSMLPTLVMNTNASQFDFLTGENLGFTAQNIDCSSVTDDSLIDLGNIFEVLNGSVPENDQHNSIYIPLTEICSQLQATHYFMTVYRNRKLFIGASQYETYPSASTIAKRSVKPSTKGPVLQQIRARITGAPDDTNLLPSPCSRQIALPEDSPVMTGTILNDGVAIRRFATEDTIAVLKFNITNVLTPLHGYFRVTWWDTEKLEWSSENQCETSTDGKTIVARCNHLTDFTLIVDAALNDPNVCEAALMDLGYTVNALSIASLAFLTLVGLSAYWPSLRSSRVLALLTGYAMPTRDLVSLSHKLSLLLFYTVFTIFSNQKVSGRYCRFFGAVSYWLLLCSVILTIFQALRLTAVIGSIRTWIHLILAPSSSVTFSFLVPFVVSVLLLVLTNFYDRGDCFCWVRPDYIIYAVIIPISFLVLNGIVCTVLVCERIFLFKRKLSKSVLQYLTLYSPYTTLWHYVFTIVMGSQGTILALLFLYKRRRSMISYRRSHHMTQEPSQKETTTS